MNSAGRSTARNLCIVLTVLVAAGVLALLLALAALREAQAGRAALAEAEAALIENRDLVKANEAIGAAARHFNRAASRVAPLQILRPIPGVGSSVVAVVGALEGASIATHALAYGTDAIATGLKPFTALGKVELGKLTLQERQRLLAALADAIPPLVAMRGDLARAQEKFSFAASHAGRLGSLRRASEQGAATVQAVNSLLDDTLPLLELVPVISGYPEPKTYLFVLQNSDEMRPTGGFIGTYGLLTLEAGHITDFVTDDVYNLDRFVPADSRPEAPEQLRRYLEQPRFYLRDANWSPDFSESAKQILRFYKEESSYAPPASGAFSRQPQGVIAIMPEAIRPLLALLGPVTVAGQIFSADNLTDALEYQVEIGFRGQGIPRPQRKAIVSELGHELIAKTFALPVSRWPEVLHNLRGAFDEKHILLYDSDPEAQAAIEKHSWAGRLLETDGDYLAVVDANMFALKTDPYVGRAISYRVGKTALGLKGTLEITYTYPKAGPFWKTKGYRSWTRVYVPAGAILSEASGAMVSEEESAPGRVTVLREGDKTVFGAFIAVQAGETKTLRFVYRLPDTLAGDVERGMYELIAQKQPGTIGHPLTVAVDFGKVPRSWSPRGLNVAREGSELRWQTSLRRDQEFKVEF